MGKRFAVLCSILRLLLPAVCSAEEQTAAKPAIALSAPYTVKVGQNFNFKVELPPRKSPSRVLVTFDDQYVSYSKSKIFILPGHAEFIRAKAIGTEGGIVWVHAAADGYEDAYQPMDAGFAGHLKLGTTGRLRFGVPAAMTISIIDSDGKPFSVPANVSLQIVSSDSELRWNHQAGDHINVSMAAGVRMGPQFTVTPASRIGGSVHLNATLATNDWASTFDQESFTLETDPVWWLPIMLAVGGGLLYGIYKVASQPAMWKREEIWKVSALLFTTSVAGLVGYLVANLDLLGLKLDPSILRTYPLLGFCLAYIGVDALLPKALKENTPRPEP